MLIPIFVVFDFQNLLYGSLSQSAPELITNPPGILFPARSEWWTLDSGGQWWTVVDKLMGRVADRIDPAAQCPHIGTVDCNL